MSDTPESALEQFRGTARLFPLPNLVLFPHGVQPLHIFEPRYRQMLEHALADDCLIAIALLKPGWEEDYEQRPAIYPVVCLGHVAAEQRLPDGRFNLLLYGLRRARILEELKTDQLYRLARVELLEDVPPEAFWREDLLRRRLTENLQGWFAGQTESVLQLHKLLAGGLGLGPLCDILSFGLPLEVGLKQELLEEVHVETRALRLLTFLEERPAASAPAGRKFPPDFSTN
jgi:Lon protease-like protein